MLKTAETALQYFGNSSLTKTILCNIINVFRVTFDQFNAYLLNKSITFFKKRTDPNLLNSRVNRRKGETYKQCDLPVPACSLHEKWRGVDHQGTVGKMFRF